MGRKSLGFLISIILSPAISPFTASIIVGNFFLFQHEIMAMIYCLLCQCCLFLLSAIPALCFNIYSD